MLWKHFSLSPLTYFQRSLFPYSLHLPNLNRNWSRSSFHSIYKNHTTISILLNWLFTSPWVLFAYTLAILSFSLVMMWHLTSYASYLLVVSSYLCSNVSIWCCCCFRCFKNLKKTSIFVFFWGLATFSDIFCLRSYIPDPRRYFPRDNICNIR